MQGNPSTNLFVRIAGCLECGHEIEPCTRLRINAWLDRTIGEDHRGHVVLDESGNGAHRRLVARDDGNQARHTVCGQVQRRCVVDQFPPDEGETHLGSAIELAVGNTQGEGRRD